MATPARPAHGVERERGRLDAQSRQRSPMQSREVTVKEDGGREQLGRPRVPPERAPPWGPMPSGPTPACSTSRWVADIMLVEAQLWRARASWSLPGPPGEQYKDRGARADLRQDPAASLGNLEETIRERRVCIIPRPAEAIRRRPIGRCTGDGAVARDGEPGSHGRRRWTGGSLGWPGAPIGE